MEYYNFDSKLPIEEKKLIVSGKKIFQSLLERFAMDVRRNKPKNQSKETPIRKSVEIDINHSPYLQSAIAKLSEAAAQVIRSTPKLNDQSNNYK